MRLAGAATQPNLTSMIKQTRGVRRMPSLIDVLVILLITTGPTKAMILFAQVTRGFSSGEKRQVALRAVLVSAIVLLVFVFFGKPVLAMHDKVPAS